MGNTEITLPWLCFLPTGQPENVNKQIKNVPQGLLTKKHTAIIGRHALSHSSDLRHDEIAAAIVVNKKRLKFVVVLQIVYVRQL